MRNGNENLKYASFIPVESGMNEYINIVKRMVSDSGYTIVDLDNRFVGSHAGKTIMNINWYDEIAGRSTARKVASYVKKHFLIHGLAKRSKIILTVHNKRPHDDASLSARKLSIRLRKYICRLACAIVVLCDESLPVLKEQLGASFYSTIEHKIVKIPHPNYLELRESVATEYAPEEGNPFTFQFCGAIRPYKNIELILDVAHWFSKRGLDARFIISGGSSDDAFLSLLDASARNLDNLTIQPGFLSQDEMIEKIQSADAMILPYDLSSCINSGTCILSFALGTPAVCPEIGTLKEYSPELNYPYSYEKNELHRRSLIEAAFEAYGDKLSNPEIVAEKRRRLKAEVEKRNSNNAIANSYSMLYDAIYELEK